ncbi:MAG TPA: shikimate dehydrogenase [Candidatus Enterenecus stercoripullorum]|nr:shikimate dehydrogenase [Candidatus Enterenecus stercoripullorum]
MSAPRLQVIGDPVLHSKSPVIHAAMLAELGLDIPYTPHVVPKGGLPGYLTWAKAHHVIGFNATMPHKEDLVPLMDQLDEDAGRIGAVNTVCVRDGKLIGHNTDGAGCLIALEQAGLWPRDQVVVLGAGGASKAVALKLAACGARQVWVCNRTPGKAQALAAAGPGGVLTPADFSLETLTRLCTQAQLVVNCTNLGMAGCGQFEAFSFLDALPESAGVFDLIYHPAQTQLLAQARARGLRACNGLPMLLHQAVLALEHFLDRPLDRDRMARAAAAALERSRQ